MTRSEYSRLRRKRPDLRLIKFDHLLNVHQDKVLRWSRRKVVAARTSVIMDYGTYPIPAWNSLPK